MKRIEYTFIGLAIVGILLFAFLVPFGSVLMIVGLSALTVFYMYFSFALFNNFSAKDIFKKEQYSTINSKRLIGSILFGMPLSSCIIGILFKLASWPAANILLMYSIYMLLFALIFVSSRYFKNRDSYYLPYFRHIIGWGLFGLILYFTSDTQMVSLRYRNYPTVVEAFKTYKQDPENEEKRQAFEQELELIHTQSSLEN